MNDLNIVTRNGRHYIDSRDVAVMVDKRHHNLLRDINGYIAILKKAAEINFDFSDFFRESTYTDSSGRRLPHYLLTKKGAALVAHKTTGEKGVLFTAAYINRFEELESRERANALTPRPQLSDCNNAACLIAGVLKAANVPPEQIALTVAGIYEPIGIPVSVDGAAVTASYSAVEIARMKGIMSAKGRPHFLAVKAIISMLDIDGEHKIIKPYQHGDTVTVYIHYDEYAANAVMEWIERNGYPCEIPSGRQKYKVRYKFSEKTG